MWHSFKLGARACSIILASISIEPVVTGNKKVISLSHKYSIIDYTVHNTQYDIGVNVSVISVNMSVIPGILCMKRNALWSTTRKSPLGNICIVCRMYIYVCNIHWLWKHALIHSWHSSTTHKELIEAPLVVTCQAFQKLPQSSDNNTITGVFHMWHFATKKFPTPSVAIIDNKDWTRHSVWFSPYAVLQQAQQGFGVISVTHAASLEHAALGQTIAVTAGIS